MLCPTAVNNHPRDPSTHRRTEMSRNAHVLEPGKALDRLTRMAQSYPIGSLLRQVSQSQEAAAAMSLTVHHRTDHQERASVNRAVNLWIE